MKYVKTYNLDIATYVIIKTGSWYKRCNVVDSISSIFYFEDTKEVNRAIQDFIKGSPSLGLHRWLTVRQQVKFDLRNRISVGVSNKKCVGKKLDESIPLVNGQKYYYIDAEGSVASNIYGSSDVHHQRISAGRAYYTRQDAISRRNAIEKV